MTRRQRVLTALRRETPDRVPVDIGGTLASTINLHAYRRLMAHLGYGGEPPVAHLSRRSCSVLPDERLLRHLDVDCRAVILGSPDAFPEQELPDGSLRDEWGVTWRRVDGPSVPVHAGLRRLPGGPPPRAGLRPGLLRALPGLLGVRDPARP